MAAAAMEAAVKKFLSGHDASVGPWLIAFQQSPEAWNAALGILSPPSNGAPGSAPEVILFAAQMLRRKVQREATNLPPSARLWLRDAILNCTGRFSRGPHPVLLQLCGALAGVLLRGPECSGSVALILQRAGEADGLNHKALLDLLALLPEECLDATNGVQAQQRHLFSQELLEQSVPVLQFLQGAATDPQPEIQRHVLRCFHSWVALGCFGDAPMKSVVQQPLVALTVQSLQSVELVQPAAEVLGELAACHEGAVQDLLPLVLREVLGHPPPMALKLPLCTLLVEIGLTEPRKVAEQGDTAMHMLNILIHWLQGTRFSSQEAEGEEVSDEEAWMLAEAMMPLWCAMVEHLGEDTQESSQFSSGKPLLDAILARAQIPAGENTLADATCTLPDELQQLRSSLEELLPSLCRLVGGHAFVAQMLGDLKAVTPALAAREWPVAEAALFALHVVAEEVVETVPEVAPQLLEQLLTQMPHLLQGLQQLPALLLLHSVANVVGSYASLVADVPAALQPLLALLGEGMRMPAVSRQCAAALRRVCEVSAASAARPEPLGFLLQLAQAAAGAAWGELCEEDLMAALGGTLSTLAAPDLGSAVLQAVSPSWDSLQRLRSWDAEPDALKQKDAVRSLTRLSTLCSTLQPQGREEEAVVAQMASATWPAFHHLLASRHLASPALADAACPCLAHLLHAAGESGAELAQQALQALANSFVHIFPHPATLQCVAAVVRDSKEVQNGADVAPLMSMLLASPACAQLAAGGSRACDASPDLAETLLQLAGNFVRCCSLEAVKATAEPGGAAPRLLQLAAAASSANHRHVALAAMSFLSALLQAAMAEAAQDSQLVRCCASAGPLLCGAMLHAVVTPGGVSRVQKAAHVLQQLGATCLVFSGQPVLQAWLSAGLQSLPAGYLHAGEGERLVAALGPAWVSAAEDLWNVQSTRGGTSTARCNEGSSTSGTAARSLKRCLREFADAHVGQSQMPLAL